MTTQQTPDQLFGLEVKRLRESKGWSMTELARALSDAGLSNFHATTVSRLESGSRAVRLAEAVVIADVLGVSLGHMVAESQDPGNDLVIPDGRLLPNLAQETLMTMARALAATTDKDATTGKERNDE